MNRRNQAERRARRRAGCRPVRVGRGYTMVEVVVSSAVVALMLVAALQAAGAARLNLVQVSQHSRGMALAQDLMTEILQQAYADPDESPLWGREPAELLSLTRALFDDVDDYLAYMEGSLKYKNGTTMPDGKGWARRVEIAMLDPSDLSVVEGVTPDVDTGLKRITVTVECNGILVATLEAIRTAAWAAANGGASEGATSIPLTGLQ